MKGRNLKDGKTKRGKQRENEEWKKSEKCKIKHESKQEREK